MSFLRTNTTTSGYGPSGSKQELKLVSVKDGYELVDSSGKVAQSYTPTNLLASVEKGPPAHVDPAPLPPDEVKAMIAKLRAARVNAPMRGLGKLGKAREISTILNYTSSDTTTAATDYKGVQALTLTNSTEFTYFVQLWDEVIVDGGEYSLAVSIATNYTTNNGAVRGVVCFDPLDSSSLASLSNGMQHSQHIQILNPIVASNSSMLPMNKDGIIHFKWRTPSGSARTTANVNIFGHEWSSTADGGDIYGYLKHYIPSAGATGVLNLYFTWTLRCRFRCRT